jgi:hypothetical protein
LIVSIHQPNYLPWLGYFLKIARSDVFVFLDDVQFSKNGYTNRTRVLGTGEPRWLTVPVSYEFGDIIRDVKVADPEWRSQHIDKLSTLYQFSPHFHETRSKLGDLYDSLPSDNLATINRLLVEGIINLLSINRNILRSSDIPVAGLVGDDRLIALIQSIEGATGYLSGRGGANYQDESKFAAANLSITYNDFEHPQYAQETGAFASGLSVIDAAFQLGWEGAAKLLAKLVPFA